MQDRVDDSQPVADPIFDLGDTRHEEAVPVIEGCSALWADTAEPDRLALVLDLQTVGQRPADGGDLVGVVCPAEDPPVQIGRVGDVERIFEGGVHRRVEIAREDRLAWTSAGDLRESEGLACRRLAGDAPHPHEAVAFVRGVARHLAVGGVGQRTRQTWNRRATSVTVEAPTVVPAFDTAAGMAATERERHISVRAAIEQGTGPA